MEIDVQCSVRLEQGSKLYLQNELDYVKMYLVVQKSWKAQAVKLQAEGPPWAVSPVTSLAWLLGCSELGGPTGGHLSFLHVTQSGSLGPSCARPWGSRTESCSPPRAYHSPVGLEKDQVLPVSGGKCSGGGTLGLRGHVAYWGGDKSRNRGRDKKSSGNNRAFQLRAEKVFSRPDILSCVTVLVASWYPKCF